MSMDSTSQSAGKTNAMSANRTTYKQVRRTERHRRVEVARGYQLRGSTLLKLIGLFAFAIFLIAAIVGRAILDL